MSAGSFALTNLFCCRARTGSDVICLRGLAEPKLASPTAFHLYFFLDCSFSSPFPSFISSSLISRLQAAMNSTPSRVYSSHFPLCSHVFPLWGPSGQISRSPPCKPPRIVARRCKLPRQPFSAFALWSGINARPLFVSPSQKCFQLFNLFFPLHLAVRCSRS